MTTQISISHFKSHCLEIIKKLETSNDTVIITKRDKPVAKIEAIEHTKKIPLFGMLKNKAKIKTDIVQSIEDLWEVEHE